ncbi:MAG: 16S rRNA (uracil(1498)-N(3))-methyltransferase [Methylophilales bacterium]|nr:16S rRNA (uracil(1498)-N(3))-methyltransferase [Methylophilales bacterium]
MAKSRFYCPAKLATGAIVNLPENVAHHATKVLRMKAGDSLTLFNGDGDDYVAEILRLHKGEAAVKIGQQLHVANESPLRVTLAQAISSGERMEFTLQKAVELGVYAIQPISAERSVVKLTGERAEKRIAHWQNVVISACEQSGRATVPQVAPILGLADWLGMRQEFSLKLLLSPTAEHTLHTLPKPEGDICLLIGCEGGLSPQEQQIAESCDFRPVRLGARILRTETAAMAALAAMQTLWGDF